MGLRTCCLAERTFEDFWIGKDVVNQQVLQKENVGSHLRDWSQGGSWKTPGRVPEGFNK